MRRVTGGRLKGRRELKLGNAFFAAMVVVMLAVLITTAAGGMVASPVEAFGTRTLGSLEIGDRVVDPSWEWEHRTSNDYSGTGETKPVTWIVVAKDHYGAGSGVTLLAEELIGRYAFDNRTSFGSNHWGDSGTGDADRGLRPWLNSNGIHSGEGFYRALSADFQSAVVQVTIPNKEWQAGYAYPTQDRVFIPSGTELGDTAQCLFEGCTYEIGSVYPFFSKASDADRSAQLGESNTRYWTRSPVSYAGYTVRFVLSAGAFSDAFALSDGVGVRPALNLKSELLVSEIPNVDRAYELFYEEYSGVKVVELSANPSERQVAGENITFTAEVTAGNTNAEFAFWYKVPGRNWTLARPYSTNPNWSDSTTYTGPVQIGVQARAVGSVVFDEARALIDYEIVEMQ